MSLHVRFELREKLGTGSTSDVYDAYDKNLRRHVAVKKFRKVGDILDDAELGQRFLVDARAAAGVSHRNILTIYDAGSYSGGVAIVMELVRDSLRKLLDRTPQLPWELVVSLTAQVADGLQCLHDNGIWHRDIKPSNILIAPGNIPKIGDFGLAHIPMSDLTRTGTVLGTPRYMSPEQARGEVVDQRTDIFSLGIVLFEMLTGQTPFERPTCADHVLIERILRQPALYPTQINPDVPRAFNNIVARALEKKRSDRFQTAAEFAAALRGIKLA